MSDTTSVEVVALIATADRPNLLEKRALPSILAQWQLPNRVVVVDDSRAPANQSRLEAIVTRVASADVTVQLLRNRRTQGASVLARSVADGSRQDLEHAGRWSWGRLGRGSHTAG